MQEESKLNGYHPSRRRDLTMGQKAADKITTWAGSWTFIFLFMVLMFVWMWLNISAYVLVWDPYPFILLNLALSCLAAIQAPIILMSQNRTNEMDRVRAEYDYSINRKAEREIINVQNELAVIREMVHSLGGKAKGGGRAAVNGKRINEGEARPLTS